MQGEVAHPGGHRQQRLIAFGLRDALDARVCDYWRYAPIARVPYQRLSWRRAATTCQNTAALVVPSASMTGDRTDAMQCIADEAWHGSELSWARMNTASSPASRVPMHTYCRRHCCI